MAAQRVRELHLFAGAGGGILGSLLLPGHEIVCCVEWDRYCARVLEQRMRDGILPDVPIWDDVRTFNGLPWRGIVDVVCAGFPCQGFSVAGKQLAGDDPRNGWPSTLRILREVRPAYALLENVPGLLGRHGYYGTILGDLAELGFDVEWGVLSARGVGAPHLRRRLWILATDAEREGELQPRWLIEEERGWPGDCGGWPAEPGVCRVAHGVANRVDKLRALGNGQVPRVAARAWRALMERST